VAVVAAIALGLRKNKRVLGVREAEDDGVRVCYLFSTVSEEVT